MSNVLYKASSNSGVHCFVSNWMCIDALIKPKVIKYLWFVNSFLLFLAVPVEDILVPMH